MKNKTDFILEYLSLDLLCRVYKSECKSKQKLVEVKMFLKVKNKHFFHESLTNAFESVLS